VTDRWQGWLSIGSSKESGETVNRSITSGVVSVVSAKIVALVVTALSTPLLYRFLGASAFGEYAFCCPSSRST